MISSQMHIVLSVLVLDVLAAVYLVLNAKLALADRRML